MRQIAQDERHHRGDLFEEEIRCDGLDRPRHYVGDAQFGGIVSVGSNRKNVGARNDRRRAGGHDEGIDVVFAHRRCGLPDGRLFRDRFER